MFAVNPVTFVLHTCSRKVELTASVASVLGTATSSSSETAKSVSGLGEHCAKEQKFIVFISRICRIHGFGRSGADSSRGRLVLRFSSSSAVIFQTIRRLSLPSLKVETIDIQCLLNINGRTKAPRERTYVTTLSAPQSEMPSIAPAWARHTARGLMIVRSHNTTKPSASPDARRSLRLMKAVTCT